MTTMTKSRKSATRTARSFPWMSEAEEELERKIEELATVLTWEAGFEPMPAIGPEHEASKRLRSNNDDEGDLIQIELGALSPRCSAKGDYKENAAVALENLIKHLSEKVAELRHL